MAERHPGRGVTAAQVPPDADVDLRDQAQRRELRGSAADVLAVVAAGGMLGAAGRHGISVALPTADGGLPWSTFLVNVTGCLLIGVLMVLIVEARTAHRLVRPFLGVGVLGGYTTFSTYAVDVQTLIVAHRPGVALAYLAGTAVAALLAVQTGVVVTRAVALPHLPPERERHGPRRGGA